MEVSQAVHERPKGTMADLCVRMIRITLVNVLGATRLTTLVPVALYRSAYATIPYNPVQLPEL